MIKYFQRHILTLLFVFIVFFDQLFFCSLILTNTEVGSGIKQYEAILLALIVYITIIANITQGKIGRDEIQVLSIVSVIILLYYVTHFFYGMAPDGYYSYLLVLGSESLPATYVGLRIAKRSLIDLNDLFSFILIISTLLFATIGMKYATANELLKNDESGLNYQVMSYFMAYSYSYCLYFIFFNNHDRTLIRKCIKYLLMAIASICFVFCVISGGRGGLFFLLFFSIVFLFICIRHRIINFKAFLLISFVIVLVLVPLLQLLDAFNSAGLDRVISRNMEDDSRNELFELAIKAFWDSPLLGNGLGSVWWTVGYYSHNIFLDVLSETGLVGFVIFMYILINSIRVLFVSSKNNKVSVLFLIILFGALFRGLFSGYWLGTMSIFMCCSYAFGLSRRKHGIVNADDLS